MMRIVWGTAALVLLQIIGTSALTLPDFSTLAANKIYFFPMDDAVCGVGSKMYYGIVTPATMPSASPKKFWMENMGGAICFNKESCSDKEFSVWLDLVTVIHRYTQTFIQGMGISAQDFLNELTKPKNANDLSLFRQLNAAYFPNQKGGPLEGELGFYFPSCSGDAGLGNYEVNYTSNMTVRHVGGVGFRAILQAIKAKFSQIERMTLIGASGTAVSRMAWAPAIADMLPQTQILVVADSAMHVLPATKAFNFFWNEVQWSPNPDGNHTLAKLYDSNTNSLPAFDWRKVSAISDMLRSYGGRIKVLYIGCVNDKVIVEDRSMLSKYAKLDIAATKESSMKEVEEETWDFLKRLQSDAPAGTAFSYITKGDCHHQTRNGFEVEKINASDPTDLGVQKFTEAFLTGNTSGPQHRWCAETKTYKTTVTAQMNCSDADKVMANKANAIKAFENAFKKKMKVTVSKTDVQKVGCRRLKDGARKLSDKGIQADFTYTSTDKKALDNAAFKTEVNTELKTMGLPETTGVSSTTTEQTTTEQTTSTTKKTATAPPGKQEASSVDSAMPSLIALALAFAAAWESFTTEPFTSSHQ